MNQVITIICLMLLHSLWQGGLLYCIYRGLKFSVLKNGHPVEKRNLLFLLVFAQVLMSVLTFILLIWKDSLSSNLFSSEQGLGFGSKPLITNSIFLAYITIVAYKILLVSDQWNRFRTITQVRVKASAELRLFTSVKAKEMGIRRQVSVWLSSHLTTPLTYGFWKPVILMPVALVNQLSTEEAETLILHELAHISSQDYVLNFLLLTSEIIFFFNPFIRLLAKEIKEEREKNCDLRVIQFKYPPLLYAGTLLKTARYQNAAPRFTLAAVSEKSALMERIKLITGEKENRPARVSNPGTYAFLFLMVMVIGLFGVSSLKQPDKVLTSQLTESYAPNEVFSFVKEVSMDERKQKNILTSPVSLGNDNTNICSKEGKTCPPKKQTPSKNISPSYVQTDSRNGLPYNYFTMPVSTKELIEKDVEITEEDPATGVITTTCFKMTWTDAGWRAQPQWQTKLNRNQADSTLGKDSASGSGIVPFYEAQ